MPDNTLITRYRPKKWGDVIGQRDIVKSLQSAIDRGLSHALLFTGPSGVGKTTLARIALGEVGCDIERGDILEYDGATLSGVDDMRTLKVTLQYRPLGGTKKGIIVDECHRLSRQAWDALLKEIEEARDYLFWVFCTTEPLRVPDTLRTRCTAYSLKAVHQEDIADLLDWIAEKEDFSCNREVIALCAREAHGSPRQAISFLAACADVESREDAAKLLRSAEAGTEAFELAQALVKGRDWKEISHILSGLKEIGAESIRHVVRDYCTKAMLGDRVDIKQAEELYRIIDAFSEPFNPADGLTPVLRAIGKIIFQGRPF